MGLTEALRKLQGEKSQGEFARELGIPQSTLSRIYSGQMELTLRTARRICRHYPELAADVQAFLLRRDMQSHGREVA